MVGKNKPFSFAEFQGEKHEKWHFYTVKTPGFFTPILRQCYSDYMKIYEIT